MPLRLSPACCAMRRPHLGLTPPLHHPHPPGDFKTPTACASTRPVRTASAGVSYAVVWPVAAAAPTRSRTAWWHLLLPQGGYRDAQRPKLTQILLCCVLGVPWHLVVHVDCSGHPCSLLGACTCCGQGWRCVTANGAVGAAQCELFQCLCAQPKLLRLNKPTQHIHSYPKLGLADAESLRIRVGAAQT